MTAGRATVVLDIEGTLSPLAAVRDVLMPYARTRIADRVRAGGPGVATLLAGVRATLGDAGADERQVVATLLGWHDADVKEPLLKMLHGWIWSDGFARGDLRGEVYPDVAPALRRWTGAGAGCWIFSSGSVLAQRGWFSGTADGDLRGLLAGYFDPSTAAAAKNRPEAYRHIADTIGTPPSRVTFLSDARAELDAARTAGWHTVGVSRTRDGSPDVGDHRRVTGLDDLHVRDGLLGAVPVRGRDRLAVAR